MAKLYFKYGVMGSGKTTELLQIAHDYSVAEKRAVICKPMLDTKGHTAITSRMANLSREVDVLLPDKPGEIITVDTFKDADIVLVDEAQFLDYQYVDLFSRLAHMHNIPVICFGLRTTFSGVGFSGSGHLFALADSVEEISTRAICKLCGEKLATKNLRVVNGVPVFQGEEVVIDDKDSIEYMAICSKDYCRLKLIYK